MIQGSIPALVTPMHHDGAIDYVRLKKLIDWHVNEGSDALVVVGTTGESPTLAVEEHIEIIRIAAEHAAQRIPIIAGTGANSTTEAVLLAKRAQAAGADAQLSVVPYYNKPTQEGLYLHFRAIAEAVDLPLILYNVPGRTVADLANETVLRLAEVAGVMGIKDATADVARTSELIENAPSSFAVFTGDDGVALATTLIGGKGVISVTANVAPRLMHEMIQLAQAGKIAAARAINARLANLHRYLFIEANPIPVKWACARMGLIEDTLRLPLTVLSNQNSDRVREAMYSAGVTF